MARPKKDPEVKPAKAAKAEKPVKTVKTPAATKAKKPDVEKPEGETSVGKNVVDTGRYKYETNDTPTASGRKSRDTGDAVAEALRGKTLEELFDVCTANGVEIKDAWREKNPGMARMTIGNVLRAKFKREGKIKINGRWLKNPEALVEAA